MLAILGVASALFTAFFEAAWMWVYQDFEPVGTLSQNFSLDLGLSAAWQALLPGLSIAAAAFVQQAYLLRMAGLSARNTS